MAVCRCCDETDNPRNWQFHKICFFFFNLFSVNYILPGDNGSLSALRPGDIRLNRNSSECTRHNSTSRCWGFALMMVQYVPNAFRMMDAVESCDCLITLQISTGLPNNSLFLCLGDEMNWCCLATNVWILERYPLEASEQQPTSKEAVISQRYNEKLPEGYSLSTPTAR